MRDRKLQPRIRTTTVLFVVVALVAFGAVWISRKPPSPADYAEDVLGILENGYYAHGEEWENAKATVRESVPKADSIEDLYLPFFEATRVAGGKHSSFQTREKVLEFQNESGEDLELPMVTTNTRITTVRIPMIASVSEEKERAYVDEAVLGIGQAAPHTCGWVVDLRGNRGGNMWPMLAAVSPLLPNGLAMSFVTPDGHSSSVTIDGAAAALEGEVLSNGPEIEKVTDTPIAVLQDKNTASSGEAVLLSFKGLPEVKTFGGASAGYSSANSVYPLTDGAQIVLTEATYADRKGITTEEDPLDPDVASSPNRTFDDAVEWLSRVGCA